MAASKKKSAIRRVARTGAAAATELARTLTNPRKTRRLVRVGKAVAPVMAPIALRAIDIGRAAADARLARKLGVPLREVDRYRGPTGRTKARISAVDHAVRQLRERRTGSADVIQFTDRAFRTLADLTLATETAGPMPGGQRRPTLVAVEAELDRLESQVVGYLVRSAS